MTNQELIKLAIEAMEHSYSPYSNFRVGAALLCSDGEVFKGCNVENASYGATICAERTALVSALAKGKRAFQRLAIVSDGEGICYPCGICRQTLSEFGNELELICASKEGSYESYSLDELLPKAFEL